MLLTLTREISDCYRNAAEARERAESATEDAIKRAYLDMESRWMALAHSYEVVERLSEFTAEVKRRSSKSSAR